ncbi:hypothetical protein [Portibacter lacus]|uniref:Lipoprotein n=1 Tax=Portibacter lacus TaxID=1099794 RepID=A0AA37SRY2_9BACT|nr:hypothetical protein [Portibacter lacus]GLR19232.1 hypothetical protein GCM10007940_38480 [Portibacter lacus]
MKKFIALLLFVSFLACKENKTQVVAENAPSQPATTTANIPPAIPSDILINLYENCDFIDFIFPNLPFSISQEDKASIQQTLRHINNVQPTEFDPQCPYFAQQIFQENGEIVLDAKIFFQKGCTYYLFYEDGVVKYSGSFTNEGILFYNNILQEAEKIRANG